MAQKVVGYVKLQIPAGKATPAPPVGPALGQHGVNIAAFTKEFNERTKNDMGLIIPVVITVYADRSFSFITKTPPAAVLIKKAQLAADASHRLVTDAEKDKWNLEYTIEKVATESGFASTYHLKKGGNKVGASINIPLDQVLRGSSIKTVTTVNTPYTGAKVGDKYVEFLFQNNNTPQYLPVQDLVDIYTGDDTYIEVSASNVIQIKYDALKNRLKTDFDAVYDAKGAAEAFLTNEENVFILDGNA